MATKLKVDFFSTLAQAKELAANPVDELAVRCTVDDADTARKMMMTLVAAARAKLKIRLPPAEKNIGAIVAAAKVERLELVDGSQMLNTSYVFTQKTSHLAVTAELPGGTKSRMGAAASPEVFDAIFDAMSNVLGSLPKGNIAKLTIKTRPPVTQAEHKQRLAEIAKQFGAKLV